MISSTTNKQVKFVNALVKKAKTRREEDLFVAEGLRMCSEIPKDRIHTLYISESFSKTKECKTLREGVKHIELVTDEVFKSLSDTQTPQGILALVKQYHYTLDEVTGKTAKEKATASGQDADGSVQNRKKQENRKKPALLMVLETIQDPGNLGTMLRTGEGAGISGVVMNHTTVDLFNPKTIRSTMGSIYRMPFFVTRDLAETICELKNAGVKTYAAHLKGKMQYDEPDYTGATAFMIGNEGNGLSDEIADLADTYIKIPMCGQVESLNAAISASLLMYETNRQRRIRSMSQDRMSNIRKVEE